MSAAVIVEFDEALDVMSARIADAAIVRARPSRLDGHLVLELDRSGRVVGIEMLSPVPLARWQRHPDRAGLPEDLLKAVDAWLDTHWSERHPSR